MLAVHVVHLFGNHEKFFGVEPKLLLDLLAIILLERVAVNGASTLELRPEADRRRELDDRRLVFDFLRFCYCLLDSCKVMIAIFDPLCVPPISLEALQDILGEGDLCVAICNVALVT
jgi:hypothetical protein